VSDRRRRGIAIAAATAPSKPAIAKYIGPPVTARPDRLHHADLAHLSHQHGLDEVERQQRAEDQASTPKPACV
jgi:hypothetical protein